MKKLMIVTIGLLTLACPISYAKDASTAWENIIKNCAKSDMLDRHPLFFGFSNTLGPGSVWHFSKDNKHLELYYDLSDIFPTAPDRNAMLVVNKPFSCSGSSATKWNLKFGLPFSTTLAPVSADIALSLGSATQVTVSLSGVSIDNLKDGVWDDSLKALNPQNPRYSTLQQPGLMVAENVVKITGFKAVFTFSKDLTLAAQASFKGKNVTLGGTSSNSGSTPTAPSNGTTGNPSSKSSTPKAGTASNSDNQTATPSKPSGTPSAGTSDTSPGQQSTNSGCGSPSSNSGGAATAPSSPSTPATTGPVTLHFDLTKSNEVTVCADGPFYIVGTYSKLLGGQAVGAVPGQAPVVHAPIGVQDGTVGVSPTH